VAGGNEAQRSDRFDLPKNTAFTHHPNVLVIPYGHCVSLCSRLPSVNLTVTCRAKENNNGFVWVFFGICSVTTIS
jgi:hypothetical protein